MNCTLKVSKGVGFPASIFEENMEIALLVSSFMSLHLVCLSCMVLCLHFLLLLLLLLLLPHLSQFSTIVASE